MYFLQKLKVKVKLTPHKTVDPLDVWKNRVPNAVAICSIQQTVVSSSVQGGMKSECIKGVTPLEKGASTVP